MKCHNSKGITLISVIITIIILIIIATTAISNIVGNNSTISRAENAVEKAEYRSKKEALQQYLNKYNSKSFKGSASFETFLKEELALTCYENSEEKKNSPKLFSTMQFAYFAKNGNSFVPKPFDGGCYYYVKYQGETFCIKESDSICEFSEIPEEWENIISNVDWEKDIIVTPDTVIEKGGTYSVIENANMKDFSYDIPANTEVTIKLISDIKITNEGLERSAINLNENSILNLKIYSNVEINSSYGKDPERANGAPGKPGLGGYAGIHVPKSAILNLYGDGTITVRGGDAGDGSDAMAGDIGGSGGGGAGAGIGGHGGIGGAGASKLAEDGGDGEDCGTVMIHDSLTVNAYGGAGGSSGILSKENAKDSGSGTGAGGYPAAGIGGGGAGGGGGNHVFGGGGYSAGSPENDAKFAIQHDGKACHTHSGDYAAGGSYYEKGTVSRLYTATDKLNKTYGSNIGGQGCLYTWQSATTSYKDLSRCLGGNVGSGGYAGCGGTVTVSKNAKINAKNGNKYTNPDSNINQSVDIYIQSGNPLDVYVFNAGPKDVIEKRYIKLKDKLKLNNVVLGSTWKYATKYSEITEYKISKTDRKVSYAATSYGQGIGSGAGYIEISNGTYKVVEN